MLQLMDESMTKVESILNEMKELAKLAAEPNVTIADRLKMQMEMEDLRYTLARALNSMSERLAQTAGHNVPNLSHGSLWVSPLNGVPNFLERALQRALSGEQWDAGEVLERLVEARKIFVGDEVIKVERGEWVDFELPPGKKPEDVGVMAETVGHRVVTTDDKNAPTARQTLEASGTILLMDVKSAKNGIERIEKELDAIREMREIFNVFSRQNNSTTSRDNRHTDTEGLRTELGVMSSAKDGALRLTSPTNPKGEMFAKIERMFGRISNNFIVPTFSRDDSTTRANEPQVNTVWVNWNPPWAA